MNFKIDMTSRDAVSNLIYHRSGVPRAPHNTVPHGTGHSLRVLKQVVVAH